MSAVAKAQPAEPKRARGGRKHRSDWRKNIDLGDVEEGLEELRAEERQGGAVEARQDTDLFVMDTAGDEKARVRAKGQKTLRLDEILGRRSAVPAIVVGSKMGEERRKKQEALALKKRLKKMAGFDTGRRTAPEAIKASDAQQNFDIWGAAADAPLKKRKTTLSQKKLGHLPALPAVQVAHPGASYRPDKRDHTELIEKASAEYSASTRKEEQLAQFKGFRGARREDGAVECAEFVAGEMEHLSDGDAEEEPEHSSADEETDEGGQKVPKRKTRVDRNRQRRVMERLLEENKARELRAQSHQLEMTRRLSKRADKTLAKSEQRTERRRQHAEEKAVKPVERIGKNRVPRLPEAVQLTEELAGSLRQLQPESNGYSQVYSSLVQRNLVEPRVASGKKQPPRRTKTTEKWSYKDFK
ncbi:hypothetical protein GGF46_002363 [Coemansia sp. RSA 552]|nr:hypothetical protein GGF46_002363 [Coemansia sp. RSA 552]